MALSGEMLLHLLAGSVMSLSLSLVFEDRKTGARGGGKPWVGNSYIFCAVLLSQHPYVDQILDGNSLNHGTNGHQAIVL